MWKPENLNCFNEIVCDMMADEDVLSMEELPRHGKESNCLHHSLAVAYMSFLVCKKMNWDYKAAARAGLLHDFALGEWERENRSVQRLWKHPHKALQNAQNKYALSQKEEDIIVKHMWPLTRQLPRHRESYVVCFADKLCALMEMCHLHKPQKVRENLVAGLG